MDINIFLLCYNESILLPYAVGHYRKYMPNCKIHILDNESCDNSVEIAKSLNCNVISFQSGDQQNEIIMKDLRNNCWKFVNDGWVIMADMDEWLCITEEQLEEEQRNGVTVLTVEGYNVVGESQSEILTDINIHEINKGAFFENESKCLCFNRSCIENMNYNWGAHQCDPKPKENCAVKFSQKKYINKHMEFIGLPYIIDKTKKRYLRNGYMRCIGMNGHYTQDEEIIINKYNGFYKNRVDIPL